MKWSHGCILDTEVGGWHKLLVFEEPRISGLALIATQRLTHGLSLYHYNGRSIHLLVVELLKDRLVDVDLQLINKTTFTNIMV